MYTASAGEGHPLTDGPLLLGVLLHHGGVLLLLLLLLLLLQLLHGILIPDHEVCR